MPEDVVPPGKIKCFITGKLRKDTVEERLRQDVARSLVFEYGYKKLDIDVEFKIKMGRANKPHHPSRAGRAFRTIEQSGGY